MNAIRAVLITLCLLLLLGCSNNTPTQVRTIEYRHYDVVYLKECPLYSYTETELAECYISLMNEVRKGNIQLKKFSGQ